MIRLPRTVSFQPEPWRNLDAYAVLGATLLDRLAAAVHAVRDRLQREPDQEDARVRQVRGDATCDLKVLCWRGVGRPTAEATRHDPPPVGKPRRFYPKRGGIISEMRGLYVSKCGPQKGPRRRARIAARNAF